MRRQNDAVDRSDRLCLGARDALKGRAVDRVQGKLRGYHLEAAFPEKTVRCSPVCTLGSRSLNSNACLHSKKAQLAKKVKYAHFGF